MMMLRLLCVASAAASADAMLTGAREPGDHSSVGASSSPPPLPRAKQFLYKRAVRPFIAWRLKQDAEMKLRQCSLFQNIQKIVTGTLSDLSGMHESFCSDFSQVSFYLKNLQNPEDGTVHIQQTTGSSREEVSVDWSMPSDTEDITTEDITTAAEGIAQRLIQKGFSLRSAKPASKGQAFLCLTKATQSMVRTQGVVEPDAGYKHLIGLLNALTTKIQNL